MLAFNRKGLLVPDRSLACSLDEMRRVFVEGFPASKEKYKVDAYVVRVYSAADQNFSLTQSDRLDWLHFWTKTAPNRAGISNKKGFL